MKNRPVLVLLVRNRRLRRGQAGGVGRQALGGIALTAAVLAWGVLAAGLVLLYWQAAALFGDLPRLEALPAAFDPETGIYAFPTRIVDRDRRQVLAEIARPGIPRAYVPLTGAGQVPSADLLSAFVAAAEPGFWTSPGYSLSSLDPGEHPTIAQKLVYSLLLAGEPPGWRRAVRERFLAGWAVQRYGRPQVLDWYLNSVDLGNWLYGVEAGARGYFGVSALGLDLSQAALLAGVSRAPAVNPWDSPGGSREARDLVLSEMAAAGTLAPEGYQQVLQAEVIALTEGPDPAAAWPDYARLAVEQLESLLGRERVERGGIIVQTALDPALQDQALCVQLAALAVLAPGAYPDTECPAAVSLPVLPPAQGGAAPQLVSAAVVLDPVSGEVLALAPGGDDRAGSTTAPGPVGSFGLPFLYLHAFAQGFSPASLAWDVPDQAAEPAAWEDGQFSGPESMRQALLNDDLRPAREILARTGGPSLEKLFLTLGLPAGKDGVLAGFDTTPLSLARAYGMLANGGVLAGRAGADGQGPAPVLVLQAWDAAGEALLAEDSVGSLAVVSPPIAYLVNHILASGPDAGEMAGRPAEKTGQVAGRDSAWAVSYFPGRVVVVRMEAVGQAAAGPVDPRWPAAAARALAADSGLTPAGRLWTEPAGVTRLAVCYPSGLLPGPDCPDIRTDIFLTGTEPARTDDLYESAEVDLETGNLATVFTPRELVQRKPFLQVPPEYQAWAQASGVERKPETYDPIRPALPDPKAAILSPGMLEEVSGKVPIRGTAAGEGFATFRLDYGLGLNPRTWVQIGGTRSEAVQDGTLVEWDTAGIQGVVALRLQVVYIDGRVKSHFVVLSVP